MCVYRVEGVCSRGGGGSGWVGEKGNRIEHVVWCVCLKHDLHYLS